MYFFIYVPHRNLLDAVEDLDDREIPEERVLANHERSHEILSVKKMVERNKEIIKDNFDEKEKEITGGNNEANYIMQKQQRGDKTVEKNEDLNSSLLSDQQAVLIKILLKENNINSEKINSATAADLSAMITQGNAASMLADLLKLTTSKREHDKTEDIGINPTNQHSRKLASEDGIKVKSRSGTTTPTTSGETAAEHQRVLNTLKIPENSSNVLTRILSTNPTLLSSLQSSELSKLLGKEDSISSTLQASKSFETDNVTASKKSISRAMRYKNVNLANSPQLSSSLMASIRNVISSSGVKGFPNFSPQLIQSVKDIVSSFKARDAPSLPMDLINSIKRVILSSVNNQKESSTSLQERIISDHLASLQAKEHPSMSAKNMLNVKQSYPASLINAAQPLVLSRPSLNPDKFVGVLAQMMKSHQSKPAVVKSTEEPNEKNLNLQSIETALESEESPLAQTPVLKDTSSTIENAAENAASRNVGESRLASALSALGIPDAGATGIASLMSSGFASAGQGNMKDTTLKLGLAAKLAKSIADLGGRGAASAAGIASLNELLKDGRQMTVSRIADMIGQGLQRVGGAGAAVGYSALAAALKAVGLNQSPGGLIGGVILALAEQGTAPGTAGLAALAAGLGGSGADALAGGLGGSIPNIQSAKATTYINNVSQQPEFSSKQKIFEEITPAQSEGRVMQRTPDSSSLPGSSILQRAPETVSFIGTGHQSHYPYLNSHPITSGLMALQNGGMHAGLPSSILSNIGSLGSRPQGYGHLDSGIGLQRPVLSMDPMLQSINMNMQHQAESVPEAVTNKIPAQTEHKETAVRLPPSLESGTLQYHPGNIDSEYTGQGPIGSMTQGNFLKAATLLPQQQLPSPQLLQHTQQFMNGLSEPMSLPKMLPFINGADALSTKTGVETLISDQSSLGASGVMSSVPQNAERSTEIVHILNNTESKTTPVAKSDNKFAGGELVAVSPKEEVCGNQSISSFSHKCKCYLLDLIW